ncbi:unnamed protein product [Schistocephalus solidus]|uniref:Uncharacterized protein n=1 Tax=Schistocephalus solidus TaxID=70667 RepID=A0A183SED8_SCHSO|nr:unnamed protein product [Schistocephalus solidus]
MMNLLGPEPGVAVQAAVATGEARASVDYVQPCLRENETKVKSLKHLEINPVTWEDRTQDRRARRSSVKTGAAIYEANRITTKKAKRAARKSPAPGTSTTNAQALPSCPRFQRIFHAPHEAATPTTDSHFIYALPSTITETFLPPPPLAPITATNTTYLTPSPQWPPPTVCHPQPPTPPQPPVPAIETRY